ncbi:MAG: FAD-binding oxidoreductase [Lachnospiraceae bacterium]|nr:FAD-binding oxidoreductase [Lachnospiraceae bacterium]
MAADKIIIGAGLYGLYAALYCAKRGQQVVVLEQEAQAFTRATYINQARVHMGYHYPRSISTALKSAGYFQRFVSDYGFCIHDKFEQIYATSANFSWTDAAEFQKFCRDANIPCSEVPVEKYFKPGTCDGVFLTQEYTYDAMILKDYLLEQLAHYPGVQILYDTRLVSIERAGGNYLVICEQGEYQAPFVLNATYASVNHVLDKLKIPEVERFALKYELCEIILCDVGTSLKDVGLTVMDGPFFSLMPFGKTGLHSLTSVTFTPHETDYHRVPEFACTHKENGQCNPGLLGNCNDCRYKPKSAWKYMAALARKYVKDEHSFVYRQSLFSMKPILKASEIDDSRPTVIKIASEGPTFISVLSGKINTVYDLDEFLN